MPLSDSISSSCENKPPFGILSSDWDISMFLQCVDFDAWLGRSSKHKSRCPPEAVSAFGFQTSSLDATGLCNGLD